MKKLIIAAFIFMLLVSLWHVVDFDAQNAFLSIFVSGVLGYILLNYEKISNDLNKPM